MPAGRKKAVFEPIAPDFDLSELVENTPHFQYVDRISCDMIDQQGMEAFDRLVLLHVIIAGKPLVVDGYQTRLDPWTFASKWLVDNHGEQVEDARDLTKKTSIPLTIGHYIKNMDKLTDQFFENGNNYKDTKSRQRIYLKDIDCPPVWQDKLREQLPPNLFYLNDNTGETGGAGALDEPAPTGGRRKGRGIAPAGDLMSSLPPLMRADNLMCYIGHEGTYTPAHREMCASLGHNIMVEASDLAGEDGKPQKPGSSIWFMTETKDRQIVQEYWLSALGHDIEVENHFAQVAAWKHAPFTTYVVEQRPGDFILIPPLAPHQVWNRGTRTMKVAWNRTTVETLEHAVKEALPNARMVCRDEQYKNKALIYYTLQKYSNLLMRVRDQLQTASSPQEASKLRQSRKIRQLQKDFKRLFNLFKDVLVSEMFASDLPTERNVQFNPFDSNITCAYCRGNIFNRFLTCPGCENALGTAEPEPYDICMECFTMGRSCGCIAKFRWAEQFKWKELASKFEIWRRQYAELRDPRKDEPAPLPLNEERAKMKTKTLAQICQEQLKRRPKININDPQQQLEELEDDQDDGEDVQVDDDGRVRKPKKKLSAAYLKDHWSCHVCCHRHPKWKMVECGCGRKWCYGTLFRGFDKMPVSIMENLNWKCPHCLGVCMSGQCKNNPKQQPYEPKGTLLGHDTKLVADVRSVESLVDFSVSNLNWLKESAQGVPGNNQRLWKRQEEAARAKADDPSLEDDHYAIDNENGDQTSMNGIDYEMGTADPALNPSIDDALDPALAGNAHGTDFVAPSAIMLNPPPSRIDDEDEDDDDVSNTIATDSVRGKKRRNNSADIEGTVKRRQLAKKHQRAASNANSSEVSGAAKQYRKEQHRKALEEARRQGRYIMVSASLKGKSHIVRLQIDPGRLARALKGTRHDDDNVLLRSDIVVANAPPATITPSDSANKSSKHVRIRVERDEDFGSRQRPRKNRPLDSQGKRLPKGYEEVEIGSDSDLSSSEDEENADVSTATMAAGSGNGSGRRRRISAWQAQRHADGLDGTLDELPVSFKDGSIRSRRRSVRNNEAANPSRVSKPSTSAPSTLPAKKDNSRALVGRVADESLSSSDADDDHDEGEDTNEQSDAAMEENENDANRIAKLSALGLVDDEFGNAEELDDDEDVAIKPVAMTTKRTAVVVPRPGFRAANAGPGSSPVQRTGSRKAR